MTNFPRVGERFLGRYEITEVLGSGGMSCVFGAIQDGLDRKVAIKVLSPVGAENLTQRQFESLAARFDREARLISSFRSPHTVVVHDYGRDGDYLYMILEHVEGLNLHELVEREGPLPPARVARIARQALGSLAEAHERGILHRDIKPQNIMVYEHLGDPYNVKVLDFGIAKSVGEETGRDARKLTEERTIVGTPSYMSPEQILGHELSPASDIYSLGLVAYELLFGIVAIEADSAVSTMARHLDATPISLPDTRQVPPQFLALLRKMIAKDVDARYRSAVEVIADLDRWDGGDRSLSLPGTTPPRAGDTLEGPPPGVPPQTEERDSQQLVVGSALLLSFAILLAVGVVIALVFMMQNRGDERSTDPTTTSAAAATEIADAVPIPATERLVGEPTTEGSEAEPTPSIAEDDVDAGSAPEGIEESAPEESAEQQPQTDPNPAERDRAAATQRSRSTRRPAQEKEEAVEPPEPLVAAPAPAPEPAETASPTEPPPTAAQSEAAAEPSKPIAKSEPEPKVAEKKKASEEDEKTPTKKKKKKKTKPPLSF